MGGFPWTIFRQNLNVLLIPENGAKIVAFRLRRGALTSALCGVGAACLLLFVSVHVFIQSNQRARMLAEVSGQHDILCERLEEIDGTITMLRSSVEQNAEYEKRARSLAGLPEEDPGAHALGLGGPETGGKEFDGLLAPELRELVGRSELETGRLLRESESQRKGYQQALEGLRERREALDHLPSIHPLGNEGWYSSGYGYRTDPFTGRRAFHAALDVSCRHGVPILSTADGIVTDSGKDGFYGLAVKIDHGNGIETVYAHNAKNLVKRGEKITRGQVIAYVGSSGRATGPHLHYAVIVDGKHVNPLGYILPEDVVVD